MTKMIFSVLLAGLISAGSSAQSRRIDTMAVTILDRMSAVIGDLKSCSFTIKSEYDIESKELGLIKHADEEQMYLQGSDKLLLRSEGDKGNRNLIFNGKTLTYFSTDKNQFGQIPLALPVIQMIDSVNKKYGIEFPVADFFYPSFVDDILAESGDLIYLGLTTVDGKECFHIAGTGKGKTFQFWISTDAIPLPMKLVIVYTGKTQAPQYEAVLGNWQINPILPEAIFEFTPPSRAREIKILPESDTPSQPQERKTKSTGKKTSGQ